MEPIPAIKGQYIGIWINLLVQETMGNIVNKERISIFSHFKLNFQKEKGKRHKRCSFFLLKMSMLQFGNQW